MFWNELLKFIFAKRSLQGLAKMFANSERELTSWMKLKQALLAEFKTATNSAQLQKLMADRKMRKGESLQEYFLQIKELASRGNIESSSLIQYVFNGIDHTCANKLVLYNAKSLIEFKDKLKCFEVISGKSKS